MQKRARKEKLRLRKAEAGDSVETLESEDMTEEADQTRSLVNYAGNVSEKMIVADSSRRLSVLGYFHIEGKKGSWLAYDNILIDGRELFLMEHSVYGSQAANMILNANGVLVMDNVLHGFNDAAKQQIRNYINPPAALPDPEKKTKEKPEMETWQKSYENGECLRSAEITEE